MSTAIATVDAWTEAGRLMLAATFVPAGFRQAAMRSARETDCTPREALQGHIYAAVEMSRALGIAPIVGLQFMCVINGRVCLYSDAPMALVMRTGKVQGRQHRLVNLEGLYALRESKIDSVAAAAIDRHQLRAGCNGTYRAFVASIKRDGQWYTEIFDTEDARRAGLLGKSGPWKQYPQRMLKFRAETYLVRNVFPDAVCGLSTADEIQNVGRDDAGEGYGDSFVEESADTISQLTEDEEFDALARQVPGAVENEPENAGQRFDDTIVVDPDEQSDAELPDHQLEPVRWEVLADMYKRVAQAATAEIDASRRRPFSFKQWLERYLNRPCESAAPRHEVEAVSWHLGGLVNVGTEVA